MGTLFAYSLAVSVVMMTVWAGYACLRGGTPASRRLILLSGYMIALVGPLTLPFTVDKRGNASVKVRLAGTTDVIVMAGSNVWSASYIDPGENVNFYVMPTNNSQCQVERVSAYCDGKFAMSPHLESQSSMLILQTICDLEGELLYQRFDRDVYFANALEADRRLRDSINALDVGPMLHEWMLGIADIRLLHHISNARGYAVGEWNDVNDNIPAIKFTPEQIAQVMELVDFDAPAMLIAGKRNFNDATAWPESSLPYKMAALHRISRRSIETGELTDADADTLRSLGDPYYLKAAKILLEAEKDPAAGKFGG